MSEDFVAAMRRATEVVRGLKVADATEIVQRALGIGGPPAEMPPARPSGRPPLREVVRTLSEGRRRLLRRALDEGLRPAPEPAVEPGAEFRQETFACAAGSRRYRLYVPASLAGEPAGLVVMLHGCTQTPEDFATGTAMNRLAEAHRLLVAYPEQTRSNNPMACWNWFRPGDQQRDGGEPAILAGLTRAVADEFQVPADRVFVAGLSAGGAMAAVLAATYPELFAAVGVHSGLPYGAANDVTSAFATMRGERDAAPTAAQTDGPVPRMIVFQGSADRTVHPSNADPARRGAGTGPECGSSTARRRGGTTCAASSAARTGRRRSNAGWSRAPITHGAAAIPPAPTPTRPAPTPRRRWCASSWKGGAGGSAEGCSEGVEHPADQRPEDRAVDADILEVRAELDLEAVGQLLRPPAGDHVRDIAAERRAQLADDIGDERRQPGVELGAPPGIGAEPPRPGRRGWSRAARRPRRCPPRGAPPCGPQGCRRGGRPARRRRRSRPGAGGRRAAVRAASRSARSSIARSKAASKLCRSGEPSARSSSSSDSTPSTTMPATRRSTVAAIHQRLRSWTSATAVSRFSSTACRTRAQHLVEHGATDRALDQRGDARRDRRVGAGGKRLRPQPGPHPDPDPRRRITEQQPADEARELAGERAGVLPLGEPVGDAQRRRRLAEPRLELGRVEEVRLEEAADVTGGARLVRPEQPGVRDRQAERAAEQRHDREPVGEPPDHARLRHRPHQPDRRAIADQMRAEVDGDQRDEHAGREPPGAGVLDAARMVLRPRASGMCSGFRRLRRPAVRDARCAPAAGRRAQPRRRRPGCR